jgi:hypothetical protein
MNVCAVNSSIVLEEHVTEPFLNLLHGGDINKRINFRTNYFFWFSCKGSLRGKSVERLIEDNAKCRHLKNLPVTGL